MNLRKSINYEIGFSDSAIVSYSSDKGNLILLLKCWNEKILKLEFSECVLFFILNSWSISDICESNQSTLFNASIEKIYEKKPDSHPYKLYQFLDQDGNPVVEIGALRISITEQT